MKPHPYVALLCSLTGSAQAADLRTEVLSTAIRSPSSHNTQPWKVRVTGDGGFLLQGDAKRTLVEVDPDNRQYYVSHGAFLALVNIAAATKGHAARTTLLPDGEDAPTVAKVLLQPASTPDPVGARLFRAVEKRVSNKRVFEKGREVPKESLQTFAALATSAFAPVETKVWTAPEDIAHIARLCRLGMEVEVASARRNRELAEWFRLGSENRKDGIGLAQSGVPSFARFFAERFFISRTDIENPKGSFAQKGVESAFEQAASASAFLLVFTRGNSRREQIAAGEAYVRSHLEATLQGVAVHPMSQIIESYPDMSPVRERFLQFAKIGEQGAEDHGKAMPQMLLRLGYAKDVPPSPRRPLGEILHDG